MNGKTYASSSSMVDVTTANFKALFPHILAQVESSSFLAIDTEFSGLLVDQAFRNNLFDNGEQRYQKLSINLRRFSILQFGLAVFTGIPDTNAYSVTSYNFYLRPHSCVSSDPIIACQTSSLEFLQKFNFNFNKWFSEGIPYMNSDEMEELRAELVSLFSGMKALHMSFEIKNQLRAVLDWSVLAEDGETHTLAGVDDIHSRAVLLAALHTSGLWTSLQDEQIVVKKVSNSDKEALEAEYPHRRDLVEKIMEGNIGFTRLFHHLLQLKKPIVLHNCLLDLMLIYKQFHKNLPSSYQKFKSDIHEMFPYVYDTKFVSEELKYKFRNDDNNVSRILMKSSLGNLATALQGELPVMYQPNLHHSPPDNKYTQDGVTLHEAGYDAFLTGLCFLRMSHLCAMLQLSVMEQHRPLSPREHLSVLRQYANTVAMQRSSMHCLSLSTRDPKTKRPPWLVVEGQSRKVRVSPSVVSVALAKYGDLDVQVLNNSRVLVATSSWKSFTDILTNLSYESHLKAEVYKRLRHSTVGRNFMWFGGVVSTGLGAWLVYRSFRKSSS